VAVDVEELGRAEMLVALAVARADAGRIDVELDLAPAVLQDVQPAVQVVEMPLDGREAPEVADAELGSRAGGVQPPGRPGAQVVLGLGCGGHEPPLRFEKLAG
jgi:hypothetical protein